MDAANETVVPGDRWRWVWLGLALVSMAGLTAYGLRQPAPATATVKGVRSVPERWAGRDVVFESVRVVEVLPGGAFIGDSAGAKAVFRGAPEVSAGEVLSVLVTYDPGSGEFEVKAARSLPRGLWVFRAVILVVSIGVLLLVIVNVHRRFRWSWRAGYSRREEGAAWRTS